jgi:hypothetical protein
MWISSRKGLGMAAKRSSSALAIAVLAVVLGFTPGAGAGPIQQAASKGTLKVKVEYKAGKVGKDHKIWVWVFDTPAIDGSTVPIAANSISENGAVISFDSLPETVYVAVAFDEKGGYDGTSGPPPSGTPVQVYGEAGSPKAIKTGAEAPVPIVFDDSVRMP